LFKNSVKFFSSSLFLNNQTFFILSIFVFFGFGVKIPVFPFHFWLTKTHVEVNTTFSIFLSGVLVKIAIIGLYKFLFLFKVGVFFFLSILILSVLDITLKLFYQVDFKKVIAYCTIFEMNFLTVLIFFNNYLNLNLLFLMCILHTTFSAIFFLINDFIYKRYSTRNTLNIPSILNNTPVLGYLIIFCVLVFNGLPMTLKFNLELVIFLKMYNFNFFLFFFFYVVQIIFLVNFSRINFLILCNNSFFFRAVDLTFFEFLSVFVLVMSLILI